MSVEKWEVITNSDGNEVVVLPDDNSDYDESFSDNDDYDNYEPDDEDNNQLTPYPVTYIEEDWGCDHQLESAEGHSESVDSVNPGTTVSYSDLKDNEVKHCTSVIDVNCDSLLSSQRDSGLLPKHVVPEINPSCDKSGVLSKSMALEQTNSNLSVYETPCDSEFMIKNESSSPAACKKKLSFDEDKLLDGCLAISKDSESQSELDSFSLGNSNDSPFDFSVYSTPCGSQIPRKNVPKSFSLQQIENSSVLKVKESFNDQMCNFSDEEVKKVSRSLEGLKNEGSFEICKSFPSLSRVIDSGYPDSNSEQEMDLDLTLEQYDEIQSLSDNESNSLPSPVHPVANLPHLIDDVQNGDVANNNRDGEGNNLVADMDEEPLEFEAQIQVDNEVLNFDGAGADMDIEPMDINGKIEECSVENNDLSKELIYENQRLTSNPVSVGNLDSLGEQSKRTLAQISTVRNGCDEDFSKPTLSSLSIETTSSWNSGESGNIGVAGSSNCLKAHNSLTTVLDGCSKFSECSLVKSSGNQKRSQLPGKNVLPDVCDLSSDLTNNSSQLDQLSIKSVYVSTESLISNTSETNEQSSFPQWLLDLTTEDENLPVTGSEGSILDLEFDIMGEHGTIPFHPRGGGDPQTYSWL